MRFIKLKNGLPVKLAASYAEIDKDADGHPVWTKRGKSGNGWISTRDLESFEEVETLARYLTAMTGKTFLAGDRGSHCSPRYDVFEAPKVGDAVSYSFNGDTYPCGYITKITPKWHITTSEGKKFRRTGLQPGFRMEGGTWSLVAGHIYEQNPSF